MENIPSENKIPNEEIITWRIPNKRYIKEWDIQWYILKEKYQAPKREEGSEQTKPSTKFHDGTKYQKETACLPPTHTW